MIGDWAALFGFQLSLIGGLVLVAEGYQFGIFFPFGWTFILIGIVVTMASVLAD